MRRRDSWYDPCAMPHSGRRVACAFVLCTAALLTLSGCGGPPPAPDVLAGKSPQSAVAEGMAYASTHPYSSVLAATITVTAQHAAADGPPASSPSATPPTSTTTSTLTLTDDASAVENSVVEHRMDVSLAPAGTNSSILLIQDDATVFLSNNNGATWTELSVSAPSANIDSLQGIATLDDVFQPTVMSAILNAGMTTSSSGGANVYTSHVSNGTLDSLLTTLGNLQSPAAGSLGSEQAVFLIAASFLSLGDGTVSFAVGRENGNLEKMSAHLPFALQAASFQQLLSSYGVSSGLLGGVEGSVGATVDLTWTLTYGKQPVLSIPASAPPADPNQQIMTLASLEALVTPPAPPPSPSPS